MQLNLSDTLRQLYWLFLFTCGRKRAEYVRLVNYKLPTM
uniref:Uncharacterized protein n=1 Tax=Ciona intestinalis TaxID=7719 RepID=H2Y175_CIOIN